MYSLIYKLYFSLRRISVKHHNSFLGKTANKAIGYIEDYYNRFVVSQYKKHPLYKKGVTQNKRDKKLIVSLTSFPKRIGSVWITIESLLRQSLKPDEIILWLAEDQFDGIDSLPKELLEQRKRGLTIRFCKDLRSHKKYFYAMQEYPDDLIVLMDDDMFYPYDTLKTLYKMHTENPNNICSLAVQVMEGGFETMPSTWRNPKVNEKIVNSDKVQIFTGSGSLFSSKMLDREAFNENILTELCMYADDLWLTFMAYKKGTKITSCKKWRAFPVTIYGTAEGSLWYINSDKGQNDEQWKNLMNYYHEDFEMIKRSIRKNDKDN